MCKRNSQMKKKKKKKKRERKKANNGMCKRDSLQKSKSNMGCVRETPQIKLKPARYV